MLLSWLVAAPALGVTEPIVVAKVSSPTSLTVFDRGNGLHLYVASYSLGQVVEYPILLGGLLGKASVYARGFSHPLGIVFGPDSMLFVSDSHTSARAGRKK